MIQELLGSGSGTTTTAGGRVLGSGERKISASPSPSNSTSTTTNTTAAATNPTQNSSENNNQSPLRCPRCDSSNTKFCYYNNYNLTQPRHFCKTCRRYWTKGGALRNVPIGGGCRKNHKTSNGCIGVIASSIGKPSTGKLKNVISSSDIIGKSPSLLTGYDHEQLSSNPNILWASPQSSHHLLALLRSTQNPNPNNAMLNSANHAKEEAFYLGSHMMMSPDQPNGNGVLNPRHGGLALDPSFGLCNNSFWRNSNQIHGDQQQQHHQLQQHNYANHTILGELQNNGGTLDHQKLSLMRSSTTLLNYNNPDNNSSPVVLAGNVISCGSNSSGILESAPVGGGGEQLAGHHHHHQNNYWKINPSLSWSDLPTTTNGAYP